MEWIYVVSSIASSLAAVLAWAAKLWWGREFAAAKDEIIKAKDAQIELLKSEIDSLKELTPMKIREYFLSVREQMEEYNNLLQKQLDEAHKELETKSAEIDNLRREGEKNANEIEKLEEDRQRIANAATRLEGQLTELQQRYENQKELFIKIPRIDVNMYEGIGISLKNLTDAMSKSYTQDLSKISTAILESSKFAEQQEEIIKQLLSVRNVIAHASPSVFLGRDPKTSKLLKDLTDDNDDTAQDDSDDEQSEDNSNSSAA